MHYYKRNIGDYAKKAGRLTMLQHGAYTLLLDACYDREQFPTIGDAIDWTWASTKEEREAVEFVLTKFFSLDEATGRYIQNRIQEELANFHENSEINKRIALEREAKRREKSTNRAQTVHEPPPNHKPLTNNQEPVTKNQSLEGTNVPSSPPDGEPEGKKGRKKAEDEFPPCSHQSVIDLYHSLCPTLPKVEVWNDVRQGYLRARWREIAADQSKTQKVTTESLLEWWKDFFKFVALSKFLTGRGNYGKDRTPFVADLEWLVRPTNFAKIIENRYHRD